MSSVQVGPDFKRVEIPTHDCFLKIVLLETNADETVKVAESAYKRILEIGKKRRTDRRLTWGRANLKPKESQEPQSRQSQFYRPRIFLVSGTFDAAAIFAAPTMELAPWLHSEPLMATGQELNVCLLPRALGLGLPPEEDFNASFLERYSLAEDEPKIGAAPADLRFVAIVKLKVSSLVLWPVPTENADEEKGQLEPILRSLAQVVATWKKKATTEGHHPEVALGIAFGWNHLLVVAHADHPALLMDLVSRLRQPAMPAQLDEEQKKAEALRTGSREGPVSHVVQTTLTTIGHDWFIRARAIELLKSESCGSPEDDKPAEVPAAKLIEIARRVAEELDPGALETPVILANYETFFQIGFHAYPGHERRLLQLVGALQKEIEEVRPPDSSFEKTSPLQHCLDVGKRDVWTPPITIGGQISPAAAVALVGLTQIWLRFAGKRPGASTPKIPAVFDSYTRISCVAPNSDLLPLEEIPENHVEQLPRRWLTKKRLQETLYDKENIEGFGRRRFIEDLRYDMKVLQFPYPVAEQLINCVSTYLWATDNEILWDSSVELIPAVVEVARCLREKREWWNQQVRGSAGDVRSVLGETGVQYPGRPVSLWAQEKIAVTAGAPSIFELQAEIDQELRRTSGPQLISLVQAFRAYFYNTQLSNYLMGEVPDLNLRFKGSLQELQSISNMMLDSLVDIVLGSRASMAIISDGSGPEVQVSLDVIVVHINTETFTTPWLLTTLAHEVGHQFLRELMHKDAARRLKARLVSGLAATVRPQGEEGLEELLEAFRTLDTDIFLDGLSNENDPASYAFVESTSDLIELMLLEWHQEDKDLRLWIKTFLLRIVLAARPTQLVLPRDLEAMAGDPELRAEVLAVPGLSDDMRKSAIVRILSVAVARLLMRRPGEISDADYSQVRAEIRREAEQIRQLVRTECVLGSATTVEEMVASPAKWTEGMVDPELLTLPWLSDAYSMACAQRFYRRLAGWVSQPVPKGYKGAARLWPMIRQALVELWASKEEGGKDVFSLLYPSLFVQHWLSSAEMDQVRETQDYESLKLRKFSSTVQPVCHEEEVGELALASQIYQRGSILFASGEDQDQWGGRMRSFLIRLISMVPAWHRSILEKVEDLIEFARK